MLALAVLTSCEGTITGTAVTRGPGRYPISPGGGTTGGSGSTGSYVPAPLVGTWQTVLVVYPAGDVQTWTTTWRFEKTGACRFTQTSYSLLEGFPRVDDLSCTFIVSGRDIVVTFPGNLGTVAMPYDFVSFSPDRLRLEGLIYERIG